MNLLDVPKEIITNVLCFLVVRDLLALELTCSFLRDAVACRQIWLTELRNLVLSARIPPLPSYVHIEQFDCFEIRSLVVKALRQLKALRSLDQKGLSCSSLNTTTVTLEGPCNTMLRRGFWNTLYYRLLPSTKLLIVADSRLLEIFDVDTGVCKWHLIPDYNGLTVKVHGFAYEECSATSFRLLVACSYDAEKTLILRLFHLEKSVEGNTFMLNVLEILDNVSFCYLDIPQPFVGDICLGGDFAVINDLLGLVVWNWRQNKTTILVYSLLTEIHDIQIVRDHLFYVLKFMYCNPCQVDIIPLRQFDDAPAMAQYSYPDIQKTYFRPPAIHHKLVRMPRVILHDLQSFGLGDGIQAVCIQHNYLMDGNTIYSTVLFKIDLNSVAEFQDRRCAYHNLFHTALVIDPSVANGLFIPTFTGCMLHNFSGDGERDDWTFRLPGDVGLHIFCFDGDCELDRVKLPPFSEACDVVLQLESNALIQVFTGEASGQKRAVIYYLA